MENVLIVANSQGFISDFLQNDIFILRNRGYKITVAGNSNYLQNNTINYFNENKINAIHIDFPIRNIDIVKIISSYNKIKQIISDQKYSLIHCHTPIVAAIIRSIVKNERNKRTKIIYTSHGFPFYKGNYGIKTELFKIIESYLSQYTDAIITICNEDFQNAKKMCCNNVYLMHGVGISSEKYTNTQIDIEAYRNSLGISMTDKVILSIGELNTNKNHQIIIKALSQINDNNIIYLVCGKELTELGKQFFLQKIACDLGVRVKFLGYRNDIPEICKISDIGAIPSLKEGLGLAGIEMLASGIPVVGSERQGIKDYVVNGKTGYLCDPKSSNSFATGIKKTFELKKKEETPMVCIHEAMKFDKTQALKTIAKVYDDIL